MLTPSEQLKLIEKGTLQIVGRDELFRKLERSCQTGTPLTVKFGMDPSAPDLHLGHTVPLRKLKQMQDLGHRIVIVIGDFTGRIGDPTGTIKGRQALSIEQVEANAKTYFEQIFKVLDPQKTQVRYNSEWLSDLDFEDILRLAATTTVAQMLERNDFQHRYKNQIPIGLHEFFYPLMQAYDSVELRADIELGGLDQTFNVLMGRSLQRSLGHEPQVAIFMPLLEGLDGAEKMSKSLGNYIGITEPAPVIFKKAMELPDSLIIRYYNLVTDEHPDTIAVIEKQLEGGANPRDIKMKLAYLLTQLYHGKEGADEALAYYDAAFAQKSIPDQIPELPLEPGKNTLADAVPGLISLGLLQSKNELLRLLEQGGASLDGKRLDKTDLDRTLAAQNVLKLGKKRFVRFI